MGSSKCAACHSAEFDAWQGSHHDLAMQHAISGTVLGDFTDAEVTIHGVTSRFFQRDGKFFVRTDGPGGEMADFEVAYTFGVYPLQQYLVPFPDGRIQALGLAWDSRPESEGGQRWFHLYPDQPIGHDDELHWTGRQQNWNYMCADCHSTNFVKSYDAEADQFASTWSEIDVACEACHGPGERHVAWSAADAGLRESDVATGLDILLRDRQNVAWNMDLQFGIAQRSEPLVSAVEVGVCADCHSRRGTLRGGAQSGPQFLDHHMPAFLTESLYFPDGQIRDEVYVWGSFKQSKMHAAGVTCSDCHEPHSLKLRAEGDAVCAQCHLPSKFATSSHHGHEAPSTAPGCLDCHMPEKTYMVVDPRRDHSIRVPRPDLTVRFGVPNACGTCHRDRSPEWLSNAFANSWPGARPVFQDWTRAFQQARASLPQAELSLLQIFTNESAPDIARATAILELAPFLSPVSGQAVEQALKDESPLVRLAALRTLEVLGPEHRYSFAGHLVSDPLFSVRSEAGRVLAATAADSMNASQSAKLNAAVNEFIATQLYNADRPEAWLNLGNLRFRTGDLRQAEKDFRHALQLAPDFSPAFLNLADLYRLEGREAEVSAILSQGLERLPGDAALYHARGLSQVRGGNQDAAIESLRKAVDFAPEETRYAYVLGVALNSAGKADEAVATLTDALARSPAALELMQLLALIERDRGNYPQARRWAQEMLDINPGDRTARELFQSIPPGNPR